MSEKIVITAIARTPMGGMLGSLKDVNAPELGSVAIKVALERSKLTSTDPEAVIMGCVLSAGLGQAPARQAALKAELSQHIDCTTINKMCGSGMKAVMFAHDLLQAGTHSIMIAGGLESMSNAPYLLAKGRAGYRLGHGQLLDSMFYDGLEDAYEKGTLMGVYADRTAQKYQFTREQQDEFAMTSLKRAQAAIEQGRFKAEIAPVSVVSRTGTTIVDTDEQPLNAKIEKIPQLKPAFGKDGTVTAANSSSISDGAAALVLMTESEAKRRGIQPIAIIQGHATFSQDPAWFTTAPVGAMKQLFTKTHWNKDEVDLFEINEAFAVVTMAAMHDLELPHAKVNIHGGACALGHPIGASGARILVTLISALQTQQKKRGVAALCIGGGEATAMAIELV
ncbi:MAG: acetyl-CoA C-acyltransferase [Legionellales bacterium]|nr:acetyl-CoA C-acyltransferase [Legionellales bacterium]